MTGTSERVVVSARKPRLLVTTTTLPRWDDDPEPRFVLDLARSLQRHFDVTLLAPSFPGARLRKSLLDVEVIRYRYMPLKSLERLAYPGGIMARLRASPVYWLLVPCLLVGQALAMRRLLATGHFQLVHAHWLIPQGLVAALFARRTGVPFVVTAHGGDVHTLGRGPLKRVLGWVAAAAESVTAVSTELCQELAGLGASRVHRIPMGVDVARFGRLAAPAQLPAALVDGAPVVMCVGRLVEKKGIHILIQALAIPGRYELEPRLVIIGDGPERSRLVDVARRTGTTHRVHFAGPVPHDQLPSYMARADVFVVPSVHALDGDRDGLPVTLLEAAATGLPIIASDIGGVGEFVVDGHNGLLVRPGDVGALARALERLLHNDDLSQRLATCAAITVKSYDWDVIADQYARVLRCALPDAGAGFGNPERTAPPGGETPPDEELG